MGKGERLINRYKLDFRLIRDIDRTLLVTMITIIIYGILNIYIATKGGASEAGAFYFVSKQGAFFIISIIALYFFMAVDYKVIYRYVPIFYWFSVFLLLTIWIPGFGGKVNGARGWINLGITNFQPAELAKFGIILMVAKIIDELEDEHELNTVKVLSKIAIYVAIPMGLIVIQPDMGMTMVCFFIVLGMLFVAGLDKRIIIGGFLILAVGVGLAWNLNIIKPYQKARVKAMLNPDSGDTEDQYQLNQSLIGIGSGGLTGIRVALDKDVSPGYAGTHVPEVQTDFIFAAISEQWGFIGSMILLGLYGAMISRMIAIARSARDRFGSLICIGMVSYFLFAITQNIGMTIGLLPITGITLPLVSYGGSSLLTTVMAVALVLNVGMRKQKIHF